MTCSVRLNIWDALAINVDAGMQLGVLQTAQPHDPRCKTSETGPLGSSLHRSQCLSLNIHHVTYVHTWLSVPV